MFFRFSMGAGLIGATAVIQALFMTVGLNNFKRIEEHRPGAMARKPATTTVIWILFLLIPIILDVTLWATFYCVGGALPSFEEALIFRLSPSRLSDTGTSFSTASGANWRASKLSMVGSSSAGRRH